VLVPAFVVFVVLVFFHILISLVLPMRWQAIRSEFQRQLGQRLQNDLENAYAAIPSDVASELAEERRQVEKLSAETGEVAGWLEQREQAASVKGLYGSTK
jgi:hypothetical protein